MTEIFLDNLHFSKEGLIPAIIQDHQSKEVLMQAYMNRDSLIKTIKEKQTYFFSRSRNELWHKGETSGNFQNVKEIFYDCDGDCLLIMVEQAGGIACHTGKPSCFHNEILLK